MKVRFAFLRWVLIAAATAALLGGMLFLGRSNYLLFHALVELFAIIVAFGIFIIAWHSRRFWENSYFLLLGVAYLFVGSIDLLHTLAYKGTGIFPGTGSNLATQLWISARGFEGLSLLAAPLLIGRKIKLNLVLVIYAAVAVLAILSIFHWRIFPTCYVDQGPKVGLTSFKIGAEYALCGLLALAGGLLIRKRDMFDKAVLRLMVCAIALTIGSELSFTLYRDPYGPANLVGHVLKLVSFFLIYKAVIETALARPYSILFRDLKRAEESLRKARDELEDRVQRRTADLTNAVDRLETEVRDRHAAERRLERERRRLFSVLRSLPGYVVLWNRDHSISFANDKFMELFGPPEGKRCYEVLKNSTLPCKVCRPLEVLDTKRTMEWDETMADGRAFRVWGYPFTDLDGTPKVLELGLEITEQRRLEVEVLKGTEAERRRIGQDIHDSLGQILTGVSCLSEVMHRKLSAKKLPEAEDAARIGSVIGEALDVTRSLARGLSPVDEEPRGLLIALRDLASHVEKVSRVSCDFTCEEPVFISDSTVATHMYRIAQEATNNALRHGRPKKIIIRLASSDEGIILTVKDDGIGIKEGQTESDGLGLRIMKYRARMIDSSLNIGRNDVGGTTVTLVVPSEVA